MSAYDRNNPFLASICERYRLNHTNSSKEVWHIVADITGSGIAYRPGDSFAILPENDPELIDVILKAMKAHGDEVVFDERSQKSFRFADWLKVKANIMAPSRKLLCRVKDLGTVQEEKNALETLLLDGNEEQLKAFLGFWNVPELLMQYGGLDLLPQELVGLMSPLLPRFYSVASSQGVHHERVEFLVSYMKYEVGGKNRVGICSHFLSDLVPLGEKKVPLYLHPTRDFLLPEHHHTPIIMIGPGTGVAPFRAFMQEREKSIPAKNWLFFGERHAQYDFFYKDLWHRLVDGGCLKLSCVFSRDQQDKAYVQHKLWDERKELWKWLQEGATLYVCGNADRMAKDVDQMLHAIIKDQGAMSAEEAKVTLSTLRKNKRYLRDVY